MANPYVVVSTDPTNTVIISGPLLWDGQSAYQLPPNTQLMLAAAALAAGYTFPAPPVSQQNASTLQQLALTALAANSAYLALGTPTAAQVAAQVNKLTRECSALIRLVLNQTDSTDGT